MPVAFASRVCRGPEVNLDSPTGELAAAIFALHKFREYLGFQEFDLVTDSTTVKALTSTNRLSGKLARWAIFLSEFRYKVIHKPGATLHNADGLSRARQVEREGTEPPVMQVWEAGLGEEEDSEGEGGMDGLEGELGAGITGGWGAQGGVHVETAIASANMAKRELEGIDCATCGKGDGEERGYCGRCGVVVHVTCAAPRMRKGYWYCTECLPHLDGGVDPAQHTSMQAHLLGGPLPPGWG